MRSYYYLASWSLRAPICITHLKNYNNHHTCAYSIILKRSTCFFYENGADNELCWITRRMLATGQLAIISLKKCKIRYICYYCMKCWQHGVNHIYFLLLWITNTFAQQVCKNKSIINPHRRGEKKRKMRWEREDLPTELGIISCYNLWLQASLPKSSGGIGK